MKLSHNKFILILSELIAINIFVIANILISTPQPEDPPIITSRMITQPKTGFGEILAQTMQVPQVLSAEVAATPPPPPSVKLKKDKYTIAIIGDSMAETMGDNLDYLQVALKKKYPSASFELYNYGIGSEKVTSGLSRLDASFDRNSRHFKPLSELRPDILIVGSYAYNPFDVHDPQKHHDQLAELVSRTRSISKVYMLAEIAPIETGFGSGPGGVNWPADLALAHVGKIEEQMQNVFKISKELTVPLIDVYGPSKKPGSAFGKSEYVSTHDHIHPSILGQIFTAEIIANSLNIQ